VNTKHTHTEMLMMIAAESLELGGYASEPGRPKRPRDCLNKGGSFCMQSNDHRCSLLPP